MRYLSYYRLNENPFGKYVAGENIYETEDTREAVARIEYAVEIDGIALITGEPGMGKTTSVRKFVEALDPELYKLIYLSAGNYKVFDFYHALCDALSISTERCQYINMYKRIQEEFIRMQQQDGIKPVVVIDDAHLLKSRILDEFKIFYDFDFDSRAYVSVILIGNEGIRNSIRKIKYESLRDRIVANYDMRGMDREETIEYVRSRLKTVGGNPDLFDDQTINAVHHAGRGNARRMNTLLTNMLMLGFGERRTTFTIEDVKRARDEMQI